VGRANPYAVRYRLPMTLPRFHLARNELATGCDHVFGVGGTPETARPSLGLVFIGS
jgi:hypothetical protein